MRVIVAIAPVAAAVAVLAGCAADSEEAVVASAAAAETASDDGEASPTPATHRSSPTTTSRDAPTTTTTSITSSVPVPIEGGGAAVAAVVVDSPAPPPPPPTTAAPASAPAPAPAPPAPPAPAPAPAPAGPVPSSGPSSPEAARAWELLNGLRRAEGLAAVVPTGDAMTKAQALADRMAAEGRLIHSSSMFGGLDGRWRVVVENVGVGSSPDHIHDLLAADLPHRNNMVDPRMTAAGIGAAWGADGQLYLAQILVG